MTEVVFRSGKWKFKFLAEFCDYMEMSWAESVSMECIT